MAASMLTAARLRELLHYDADTGVFTWLKPSGRRVKAGDVADTIHSARYLQVHLDGRHYYLHRLAWLYVTGEWPAADIDHINGDRADNRIANLREATRSQNLENQRAAKSHSRTGVLGITPTLNGHRFVAAIVVNGRRRHLGIFDTPEEAHAAYLAAKRMHHSGCTI